MSSTVFVDITICVKLGNNTIGVSMIVRKETRGEGWVGGVWCKGREW